jgi:hypothetical protein
MIIPLTQSSYIMLMQGTRSFNRLHKEKSPFLRRKQPSGWSRHSSPYAKANIHSCVHYDRPQNLSKATRILSTVPQYQPFILSSHLRFGLPRCLFHKYSLTKTVYVRYDVFTVVTMNNAIFWDVTSFRSYYNRRFEGMCRFRNVNLKFIVSANVLPN